MLHRYLVLNGFYLHTYTLNAPDNVICHATSLFDIADWKTTQLHVPKTYPYTVHARASTHTHPHPPLLLLTSGCVLSLVVSGCARSAGAWPAQRSSTTVTTKRPRRTRASRAWALRTSGSVLDPAVRSLQLGMVPSHSSRFAGNSKASAGVAIDCNKVSALSVWNYNLTVVIINTSACLAFCSKIVCCEKGP